MKALAAFLLGLTLGVTFIIFGETAVNHIPGQEPASVWGDHPALRH
ncbi:hypothetical protein [Alsobacter sp. SYSU BS001988]|jgi:hypothetical protein